jgi:hypothetical protein
MEALFNISMLLAWVGLGYGLSWSVIHITDSIFFGDTK